MSERLTVRLDVTCICLQYAFYSYTAYLIFSRVDKMLGTPHITVELNIISYTGGTVCIVGLAGVPIILSTPSLT